jgi:hypothetical protein
MNLAHIKKVRGQTGVFTEKDANDFEIYKREDANSFSEKAGRKMAQRCKLVAIEQEQ